MGSPLYMRSIIDWNVVIWRIPVFNVCHPCWVHCYVECICWYLIHFMRRSWDLEHLKLSWTCKWSVLFFFLSIHNCKSICIYNAHKTDHIRNFCHISHQTMKCYNSFILEDVLLKTWPQSVLSFFPSSKFICPNIHHDCFLSHPYRPTVRNQVDIHFVWRYIVWILFVSMKWSELVLPMYCASVEGKMITYLISTMAPRESRHDTSLVW